MMLDEMMDEMAARTEFDDAYVATLATAFANASPEEMDRAFERMRDALARQTPEQKACLQRLNLELVKQEGFVDALRRHNERRTKAPTEPPATPDDDAAETP